MQKRIRTEPPEKCFSLPITNQLENADMEPSFTDATLAKSLKTQLWTFLIHETASQIASSNIF